VSYHFRRNRCLRIGTRSSGGGNLSEEVTHSIKRSEISFCSAWHSSSSRSSPAGSRPAFREVLDGSPADQRETLYSRSNISGLAAVRTVRQCRKVWNCREIIRPKRPPGFQSARRLAASVPARKVPYGVMEDPQFRRTNLPLRPRKQRL
jgi:hypothetical protein